MAGYTIFEHPAQLVVALSTAQIVTKAMQICYREEEFGDGPLLMMLTARSAEPFMGKKREKEQPNGQRYEDWATKALQDILGESPMTWARIVADGGHVQTASTILHRGTARAVARPPCGQASQGTVNVLLAAADYQ